MQPLSFSDLQDLLQEELRSVVSASDLHGMVAGEVAVAGSDYDAQSMLQTCLEYLDPQAEVGPVAERELLLLLSQTHAALEDSNLGFEMLLPDEEAQLPQRALALAQWCQGFLYGFAIAEKKYGLALSEAEENAEVLSDFAAISKASAEDAADDLDNEQDFMHLTEYIRVASMNMYAQCALALRAAPDSTGGMLTVH